MPSKNSVLVQCNRRGPVTAGPLTLNPGINEVSAEDLAAFKGTKTGKGAFGKKMVELVRYVAEEPEESKPSATPEDPVGDSGVGGGDDDTSSDDAAGPVAPTLALGALEAIEFVKTLTEDEVLGMCYDQEDRVTVRKACVERAEELEDAAEVAGDNSDDEPGDDEPEEG